MRLKSFSEEFSKNFLKKSCMNFQKLLHHLIDVIENAWLRFS